MKMIQNIFKCKCFLNHKNTFGNLIQYLLRAVYAHTTVFLEIVSGNELARGTIFLVPIFLVNVPDTHKCKPY